MRVFHGEVFLVVAHDRDQHLLRQAEETLVEAPEHHRRPLGKVRDCVDELLVFTPARARSGAGGAVKRLADGVAAGLHIDHDVRCTERVDVGAG